MDEQDCSVRRVQVTRPPVALATLARLAGGLTVSAFLDAPVDDHPTIWQVGETPHYSVLLCDLLPRHDDDTQLSHVPFLV